MNIISQDLAKIEPEDVPRQFLYHAFKTDKFKEHSRSMATGTTVLHLSLTSIGEFQLALPPQKEMQEFAENVKNFHDEKANLIQQNSRLEDLRDAILPKLISGNTRVNDINLEKLESKKEV